MKTILGVDPGALLTNQANGLFFDMDYSKLTRTQRYNLRKKGHDVPLLKPGKPSIIGYKSNHTMICAGCGMEFCALKDPATSRNFCSAICYRSSLSGSFNPNYKGGEINKKCKGCGKHFTQKRDKYQSPYCAKECRIETMQKKAEIVKLRKRIKDNVRRSILSYVKRGTKNNRKWQDLLGYTTKQLCDHLESKFDGKMNWNNYGTYWHMDHITPASWFKFTTPDCEAFKKCWAIKNLQPLESKANIRKGNKLCLV